MERLLLSVAHYPARRGRHRLKSLDRGLRLALLNDAEYGVEQDNGEDYNDLRQALAGHYARHRGNGGGTHKDDQHRVFQLLKEAL